MSLIRNLPYTHPYRWDGREFGGPQLWRPSNIGPSLALWLDAEDAASITLNGSTVSEWRDKSGNARHVSQATAANQPTYTASGLNGRPVLSFSGTNALSRAIDNFVQDVPAASIFTVVRYTDYALTRRAVQIISGSTARALVQAAATTGTLRSIATRLNADTTSIATGEIVAANTPAIQGAQYDYANNSHTSVVNGVVSASVAFSSGGGNSENASTSFSVGTTSVQLMLGDIAEVVFVSGILSTADRVRLEGYLAWKWGLEANLPSDHPFKTTPPTI